MEEFHFRNDNATDVAQRAFKMLQAFVLRGKITRAQAHSHFSAVFDMVFEDYYNSHGFVLEQAEPLPKSISPRFDPLVGRLGAFGINQFQPRIRRYEEINSTLNIANIRVTHNEVNATNSLTMFMIGHHAVARMMEREISPEPLVALMNQAEKLMALTYMYRCLIPTLGNHSRIVIPLNEHALFGKLAYSSLPKHIFSVGMTYKHHRVIEEHPLCQFSPDDPKDPKACVASYVKVVTAIEYNALTQLQETLHGMIEDFWQREHIPLLAFTRRYNDVLNSGIDYQEIVDFTSYITEKFQPILTNRNWIKYQANS